MVEVRDPYLHHYSIMHTTPWVKHFIDRLEETLPVCKHCNAKLHPNGRVLQGLVWVKDSRFTQEEPDKFVECT